MNKCNVIKDLLPLYAENIASEDTKKFVEEHLQTCAECKAEYEKMQVPEKPTEYEIEEPLKAMKKLIAKKRLMTVAATILVTAAIFIVIFSGLTTPKYLDYSEDLFTVTEIASDTVEITLNATGIDYDLNVIHDEQSGKDLYFMNVWTTVLHKLTGQNGTQLYRQKISDIRLYPDFSSSTIQINGKNMAIFYSQNNGEDDILIYGELPEDFGSIRSLPRLFLGYYVIIAAVLALSLTAISIIVEKKNKSSKLLRILSFITPIPYLYLTAHFCLMLTGWTTYSAARYLILIIALQIVIYWFVHLISGIIRLRKELNEKE